MRLLFALIAAFLLYDPAIASAQSLRGGRAAMTRQNACADADDLTRLQDLDDLKRFIAQGYLVSVSDTRSYYLDGPGSLDPKNAEYYRYTRPWTKNFLGQELGTLLRKFGHVSKIPSLVRTQVYQDLICDSGNRAATCGEKDWEISTHLTGAAVDVSKRGMSRKALRWFRARLRALQRQGKIHVIEERGAFHILVRKAYGQKAAKKAKKTKAAKKNKKKSRRSRR